MLPAPSRTASASRTNRSAQPGGLHARTHARTHAEAGSASCACAERVQTATHLAQTQSWTVCCPLPAHAAGTPHAHQLASARCLCRQESCPFAVLNPSNSSHSSVARAALARTGGAVLRVLRVLTLLRRTRGTGPEQGCAGQPRLRRLGHVSKAGRKNHSHEQPHELQLAAQRHCALAAVRRCRRCMTIPVPTSSAALHRHIATSGTRRSARCGAAVAAAARQRMRPHICSASRHTAHTLSTSISSVWSMQCASCSLASSTAPSPASARHQLPRFRVPLENPASALSGHSALWERHHSGTPAPPAVGLGLRRAGTHMHSLTHCRRTPSRSVRAGPSGMAR